MKRLLLDRTIKIPRGTVAKGVPEEITIGLDQYYVNVRIGTGINATLIISEEALLALRDKEPEVSIY
jgi:hypothetical protein